MKPSPSLIRRLHGSLPSTTQNHVAQAISKIVAAKERGGRVVVVTGSGPNIHEGITTQIAELIRKGLVDAQPGAKVVCVLSGGNLDTDQFKSLRIN